MYLYAREPIPGGCLAPNNQYGVSGASATLDLIRNALETEETARIEKEREDQL